MTENRPLPGTVFRLAMEVGVRQQRSGPRERMQLSLLAGYRNDGSGNATVLSLPPVPTAATPNR